MIFLVRFGINQHSLMFQKPQITRAREKCTCADLSQIALQVM